MCVVEADVVIGGGVVGDVDRVVLRACDVVVSNRVVVVAGEFGGDAFSSFCCMGVVGV